MIDISYARHAETRMQQRAIRKRMFHSLSSWEHRLTTRLGLCATEMLAVKSRASRGRYTGWNASLIAKS